MADLCLPMYGKGEPSVFPTLRPYMFTTSTIRSNTPSWGAGTITVSLPRIELHDTSDHHSTGGLLIDATPHWLYNALMDLDNIFNFLTGKKPQPKAPQGKPQISQLPRPLQTPIGQPGRLYVQSPVTVPNVDRGSVLNGFHGALPVLNANTNQAPTRDYNVYINPLTGIHTLEDDSGQDQIQHIYNPQAHIDQSQTVNNNRREIASPTYITSILQNLTRRA